jgi:signal transduction histidine kinase
MAERFAVAPVRARVRRHADLLVALAVGVELQAELFLPDAPQRDVLIARGLMIVLTVGLAIRRRTPLLAALLALAVIDAMELISTDVTSDLIAPFFVFLFLAYSMGAHAHGRRTLIGGALMFAGGIAGTWHDDPPVALDDVLFVGTILVGGPILLGRLVHARLRLTHALREKTDELESGRDARSAAAVAAERARIAGELHDLVRDALAAMVRRADGAERLARSDARAAEQAFAMIEATGREALGEIRVLLGVLRRDDEELALAPQPSLAHLSDLIARTRAAGLPVDLEVEGAPATLPAGLDLTAYRVVQEALGGALEACDGRRATVRVRYALDELVLEVSDAGGVDIAAERPLLGIQERVALYGGELVTAARGESGHAVRARLPLEHVT